jgi:nitroreductase
LCSAAAVLVFAAGGRTTRNMEGGVRYVHIEVGHAAQNVFLQATALGLEAVVVGAFNDRMVQRALNLPEGEAPLYLMPVGRH